MTCGINIMACRLAVAAVGGAFAGLAGVLYAETIGYLDPGDFTIRLAILFLVMVVVGGIGSNAWTVFAAVVFTYLTDGLTGLTTTGPLIYGLTIVVVLLVAPGGVASIAARIINFSRNRVRRSGGGLASTEEAEVNSS
jgi:branched-chain amino acid transport system permease protein